MEIITDTRRFQEFCWAWRCENTTTALVPTMGFFHAGHTSLMDWAGKNADKVIVSLFVNPTQFGPNEDLDAYPRDAARDEALAREHGVNLLFMPEVGAMYEPDHATWIEVPDLARNLCGKSRPVHFRGVATIVTKLLLLAMPTLAVFGRKDWQQLAIIKRMARDLNLPVRIKGRPIVREEDGLAMSSRNAYLSPEERVQAPQLNKGLHLAAESFARGERRVEELRSRVLRHYSENLPSGRLDYLEFVDADSLEVQDQATDNTLAAVAMHMGKARLIDNMLLREAHDGK